MFTIVNNESNNFQDMLAVEKLVEDEIEEVLNLELQKSAKFASSPMLEPIICRPSL